MGNKFRLVAETIEENMKELLKKIKEDLVK